MNSGLATTHRCAECGQLQNVLPIPIEAQGGAMGILEFLLTADPINPRLPVTRTRMALPRGD